MAKQSKIDLFITALNKKNLDSAKEIINQMTREEINTPHVIIHLIGGVQYKNMITPLIKTIKKISAGDFEYLELIKPLMEKGADPYLEISGQITSAKYVSNLMESEKNRLDLDLKAAQEENNLEHYEDEILPNYTKMEKVLIQIQESFKEYDAKKHTSSNFVTLIDYHQNDDDDIEEPTTTSIFTSKSEKSLLFILSPSQSTTSMFGNEDFCDIDDEIEEQGNDNVNSNKLSLPKLKQWDVSSGGIEVLMVKSENPYNADE